MKAYYDRSLMTYIEEDLYSTGLIEKYCGNEKIRKTASFYGDNFNVYIDFSDGVNEILGINEYCGRMYKVIEDSAGKPFLYFKCQHSFEKSKNLTELAKENNGKVIPFFIWPPGDDITLSKVYSHIFPRREQMIKESRSTEKKYDIGFYAGLGKYTYPKPSENNPLISWTDTEWGSNGVDMGLYDNFSRKILHDKIESSRFNIIQKEAPYSRYISSSFECKTILNPPGISNYTSRMFDQCALGNCIVLRKTVYDNAFSWKDYLPELDFESDNWENEYQDIVDNYEEWGDKAKEYFDLFWSSESIVDYFVEQIEEWL